MKKKKNNQIAGARRETPPITLETRDVTLETRGVTLETRDVTLETRGVTLETRGVTLENFRVSRGYRPPASTVNNYFSSNNL
jgi:hypothetical protein